MIHKVCNGCKLKKPATDFNKQTNGKFGLRGRCISCNKLRAKTRRSKETPEKREARLRRMRESSKLRQFGLSPEMYQAMVEERDNRCDICSRQETRTRHGNPLPLCVDHDTQTGKVRGLLCSNHNVGIGLFNHDPNLLKKAIRYLKEVN